MDFARKAVPPGRLPAFAGVIGSFIGAVIVLVIWI
jgi:hypothetical protein